MPDVRSLLSNPSVVTSAYSLPVVQDRRRYYIVEFHEVSGAFGTLLQRIWFDQSTETFDLVRRQTFDRKGELEIDTQYSGHQSIGTSGVRYPSRVDVEFAAKDTVLKVTMDPKDITLNGEVDRDAFNFRPRPGAQTYRFEPREAVSQQR